MSLKAYLLIVYNFFPANKQVEIKWYPKIKKVDVPNNNRPIPNIDWKKDKMKRINISKKTSIILNL